MTHTVYIALGTNLGDRLDNLHAAIEALEPKVSILIKSHVYETPPWGYEDQPAFLNMVVKAEASLEPAITRHAPWRVVRSWQRGEKDSTGSASDRNVVLAFWSGLAPPGGWLSKL